MFSSHPETYYYIRWGLHLVLLRIPAVFHYRAEHYKCKLSPRMQNSWKCLVHLTHNLKRSLKFLVFEHFNDTFFLWSVYDDLNYSMLLRPWKILLLAVASTESTKVLNPLGFKSIDIWNPGDDWFWEKLESFQLYVTPNFFLSCLWLSDNYTNYKWQLANC